MRRRAGSVSLAAGALTMVLALAPPVSAQIGEEIVRISVATDGTEAIEGGFTFPAISADGNVVAFSSTADNLVAGDTNLHPDIFVHDATTGTTTRVSVASEGTEGNDASLFPSISADGRFVAFSSSAANLVADDSNGQRDIFVHDRTTGETTRVSVPSAGLPDTEGNQRAEFNPSISADGRFVAFASRATNLIAVETANTRNPDIFVHDRTTGETTRVSAAAGGANPDGASSSPALSGDGRFVVFSSAATNLVAGDTNGASDIFVVDRQTDTTTRVSVATGGTEADAGPNISPAISDDGSVVAFASGATNLVAGDTNDQSDVFVHELATGTTTRVSVASDGSEADNFSVQPALSADGAVVAFDSAATNLVPGDTNARNDVFVHERATGETVRVSVAANGTQADGASFVPALSAISADGGVVAFSSDATNLVVGDTNNDADVFVAPTDPPAPVTGLPPVHSTEAMCANVTDDDPFTDDDGTTFEEVIACLAHSGITRGATNTTFEPNVPVTRAQMASFIARAIDTANELEVSPGFDDLPAYDGTNDFTDVEDDDVHVASINRLADAEVVLGGPGGRPVTEFGPELDVTRAQMASFINRAQEFLTGNDFTSVEDYFTDDDGNVHEDNINGIASQGIAVGDGVASYGPDNNVTRGQMSAFLMRHLATLQEAGLMEVLPAASA